MLPLSDGETIAAIATAPGKGGIGIVRISGSLTLGIAERILSRHPKAREACFCQFMDEDASALDEGIALLFPAPHSFTGEDVLELQGHGGPVVLDLVLQRVLALGARLAHAGEFSARAFLNDKMDLSQAEAVADLIDSSTQAAARSALRSLQGQFSHLIRSVDREIVELRMFVEAAIDFPEEEIDFLSDERITARVTKILDGLQGVLNQANEQALFKEGLSLVLAGRPNAGKSSLMNQLSGRDASIVTTVPGTTRDLISEQIHIDGIPLRLVDTAGIREARDEVEKEGVKRARNEIEDADGILLVVDAAAVDAVSTSDLETGGWQQVVDELLKDLPPVAQVFVILNKVDLLSEEPVVPSDYHHEVIQISALTGRNLTELKRSLRQRFGSTGDTGNLVARTRQVRAITSALQHATAGAQALRDHAAGELLAEELRLSHELLGEITGEFTSEDLLGEIFSSFCIGK